MPRSYGITNLAPWASAPPVGPAGDTYWNTALNRMFISNGTAWLPLIGVPPAGTAGQVLSKSSATDYDATWYPFNGQVMSTAPSGSLDTLVQPGVYVRTSVAGDPVAAGFSSFVEVIQAQTSPAWWITQRMWRFDIPGVVYQRTTNTNSGAGWSPWQAITPTPGIYYEELAFGGTVCANNATVNHLATSSIQLQGDFPSAYNFSTGAWTCPANGVYSFEAHVTFGAFTSAGRLLIDFSTLALSGGTIHARQSLTVNAGIGAETAAVLRKYFTAGQLIYLSLNQASGGSLTVATSRNNTYSIQKVG